ncbi:MAG: cell division protein FtsW [Bacteroidetes bacterium]|nr:MAG: cell division protein FtsW [Bacteroidota bacterium]
MSKILGNLRGDRVIWVIVILLSIFSLLTVYSSTGTLAYKYQSGNTEYYMMKHLIILLFGFLIMYLTHMVKFTYFSRIFQIALYIAVPLLILTLFVGLDLNEAKRVLPLPFNLTFQTSDLAKITLILYLARLLSKKQDNIKDFKSAFLPLMIPVLIVCVLILPANFSTAAMLFVTSLVLMFIGRVNLKYIFSLIGIGIVSFVFLLLIANAYPEVLPRADTWKTRIVSFMDKENIDPDKNYQVEQAKIAIAEGGLIGKFPGNSTQRNFLPHPYSDFIFAIFLEEYGLAGGSFLVLLYMILFYRVVRIVTKIPRNFGAFMAVGLGFSLVFQAMINMAVAVNLIPVTGQPLPLISMGGTSIWFTSISLGVILSVSREIDTSPEKIEDYVTA